MNGNKPKSKSNKSNVFKVWKKEANVSFPASQERVDKLEEKLLSKIYETRDQVTANYISVLGIFASIVTFLLIEIQILRNICDFNRLMGFSFFVVGLLLVFVVALHFVLAIRKKEEINKFSAKTVLITIVVVFFTGCIILLTAQDEYICKLSNLDRELDKRLELMGKNLDDKVLERHNQLKLEIEKSIL